MHIEDEKRVVVSGWIFDVEQRRIVAVQPVIGVSPEVSRDGDGLGRGAGGSDGVDGGLDGGSPRC